jgi:hypothetical protein
MTETKTRRAPIVTLLYHTIAVSIITVIHLSYVPALAVQANTFDNNTNVCVDPD